MLPSGPVVSTPYRKNFLIDVLKGYPRYEKAELGKDVRGLAFVRPSVGRVLRGRKELRCAPIDGRPRRFGDVLYPIRYG